MSSTRLEYFDPETRERFLPHVIEPAAGPHPRRARAAVRGLHVDESRPSPEFLRFHPRLAPIKAADLPAGHQGRHARDRREALPRRAPSPLRAQYDVKQSIGKRYARMDEAGTPYCFTIDGRPLKDQTVTVRDRDTGGQERIAIDRVLPYLGERLG